MRVTISTIFRIAFNVALVLAVLGCAGCGLRKNAAEEARLNTMGAPVTVGALTYTVVDSQWAESLNGATGQRLPKNRFLMLDLSVTNNSGVEVGVPLLSLVDAGGKEYREEDKGDGLAQWFGLLRTVQPSQTEHGRVLFDVPQAGYKLRLSSGGDVEKESTTFVEIPLRVEAPPVKGVDPVATPGEAK